MMFDKDLYDKYENGGIKETVNKRDYTLLPFSVIGRVVDIMEYGANKYSRDNWKKVPRDEYLKAGLRHIVAVLEGEETDKESGFNHLDHAVCNMIYAAYQRTKTEQFQPGEVVDMDVEDIVFEDRFTPEV